MARRTNAPFNKVVLKRLCMSRNNRPPLSLARLVRKMKVKGYEGKIAVVVGTVTDDVRVFEIPALKVCGDKNFGKKRFCYHNIKLKYSIHKCRP